MKDVIRLLKAAFPHTIPVLTGYIFMGAAFGILLTASGFNPVWALVAAVVVYAGSAQFISVGLLAAGFDPLAMFVVILMVNARHIFYGLSSLSRFREFGKYRPYLIFALTDETYALFSSVPVPPELEERRFLTAIAALDQSYWIIGCAIGAFFGSLVRFNWTGIDFIMTALFVVILIQRLQARSDRVPAVIGLAVSVACRLVFGSKYFIISAMLALLCAFALAKPIFAKASAKAAKSSDCEEDSDE